ncbi:MAG: helix-hairpin-helix domain-containing protein [Thermoanaerobaculia bacterium]
MSPAKNTKHPTAVELSTGVFSLISGVKLLRHVLDCDECRAEYSTVFQSCAGWFICEFWVAEGLSERVARGLADGGILGVSDLKVAMREKLPGIGRKGAEEIRQLLASHKEGDSD